jgi:uncharacterized DUF497 family protein
VEFEWDEHKAVINLRKHHISFVEAASVFGDPLAITVTDPDHSAAEQRELTFGCCSGGRVVVVAHIERGGRMRLISARRATSRERRAYEQGADYHA